LGEPGTSFVVRLKSELEASEVKPSLELVQTPKGPPATLVPLGQGQDDRSIGSCLRRLVRSVYLGHQVRFDGAGSWATLQSKLIPPLITEYPAVRRPQNTRPEPSRDSQVMHGWGLNLFAWRLMHLMCCACVHTRVELRGPVNRRPLASSR
jgi:hypothetical protein